MTTQESTDAQPASEQAVRRVPLDLLGVCLVALGSAAVYYTVSLPAIRFLAAIPLVLFLPGYALVSILFPQAGRTPQTTNSDSSQSLSAARNLSRVTIPERLGLSFGLSVAVVPLVALFLEVLPVEAFSESIVPTLVGGVLIGTVIGAVRRFQTPPGDRFQLPTAALTAVRGSMTAMKRTERIATVGLAVAVVLAVVSVGYVFAVPQSGEQYTDLRILTDTDDEQTFGDYPDEVPTGEETDLIVGIDNHEQTTQSYTVVVTTDQLIDTDQGVTPIESTELTRFSATLDDGERLEQPQTVTFGTTGEYRLN